MRVLGCLDSGFGLKVQGPGFADYDKARERQQVTSPARAGSRGNKRSLETDGWGSEAGSYLRLIDVCITQF